jgi:hypothetical protein
MNEPVIERPAAPPAGTASRMTGVITSPGPTFEEITRRPSWITPVLVYVVAFILVFGYFSMKADWVAIMTDQLENNPFMGMVSDTQRDQIVSQATADIKKMSPTQMTLQNVVNYLPWIVPMLHLLAMIFSTLFVMMGSLPRLQLGKAWLNFLGCLLVMIAYFAVFFIAQVAFKDAADSRILLGMLAGVATATAWIWLLNRRAKADPEFHAIMAVVGYGSVVLLVGVVALLALTIVTPAPITTPPQNMVKANLGALVKTGIPALQKLLEAFDLFWLWFFSVLTIGFRPVTKLSTGVTAAITFLPWAVVVMLSVAFAAVFG